MNPETQVDPGILAFAVFFLLAIALWFLMRNMNSRLRRMSYAHKEEDRRAAEKRAQAGQPGVPDLSEPMRSPQEDDRA